MLSILGIVILLALAIMACIAIVNCLTFPRLGFPGADSPGTSPHVSVLIPARNEEAVIARTILSWQEQDYANYEVIVLDDDSTDATGRIIRNAIEGRATFRMLEGAPLPMGWKGKNWACSQLARVAKGEILVFTDADVVWDARGLSYLVALREQVRADLLTIWPTQVTVTWAERMVVPMMMFSVIAYLPLLAVHHLPWPVFAAANGQCLVFTRQAYELTGGHDAVRNSLVEDMAFARRIKSAGMRLRMADGAGMIRTRMYGDWREVRDGFAKNILSGHGGSPALLLLSTAFHLLVFILPWCWFLYALFAQQDVSWPLMLVLLGLTIRALTAAVSGQRLVDAVGLPISVVWMTGIAVRSLVWHYSGGVRWKGRSYGR